LKGEIMHTDSYDPPPMEDPHSHLERALIDEFLHTHGYDRASLKALPEQQASLLLAQASTYAAGKLTEVECRAHYVNEIHRGRERFRSARKK
jgi:hypothetical protein